MNKLLLAKMRGEYLASLRFRLFYVWRCNLLLLIMLIQPTSGFYKLILLLKYKRQTNQ